VHTRELHYFQRIRGFILVILRYPMYKFALYLRYVRTYLLTFFYLLYRDLLHSTTFCTTSPGHVAVSGVWV